jgi:hypothetical protein
VVVVPVVANSLTRVSKTAHIAHRNILGQLGYYTMLAPTYQPSPGRVAGRVATDSGPDAPSDGAGINLSAATNWPDKQT